MRIGERWSKQSSFKCLSWTKGAPRLTWNRGKQGETRTWTGSGTVMWCLLRNDISLHAQWRRHWCVCAILDIGVNERVDRRQTYEYNWFISICVSVVLKIAGDSAVQSIWPGRPHVKWSFVISTTRWRSVLGHASGAPLLIKCRRRTMGLRFCSRRVAMTVNYMLLSKCVMPFSEACNNDGNPTSVPILLLACEFCGWRPAAWDTFDRVDDSERWVNMF